MIALNEAQMAAVTAPVAPALVLAGAGSGKTRVIIERLAWLIEERGVDPRHLLALTFTNRAAAEMNTRLAARLGVERVGAWVGTFHSFGLFVLRREMEHLGRPKAFTVFDDTDQLSLMKRLVKDLPGEQQVTPREALGWLSRLKQDVESPGPPSDPREKALVTLWEKYHATLKRASAVDFDDLLVLLVELFEQHPAVREKYQQRYRHVLVDEYQDTNHAQYEIARLLSADHGSIFVVGDEDQSIYSWRGADINNILNFAKDFSEATVYRLEQNYRSTKAILEAANAVVSNNVNRLGKTLWTAQPGGERVRYFLAESGDEEARFAVEDMAKRGVAGRETAVLYRTNGQSRQFEEALRARGLNYIVVGGIKFYARKEIKDIVAYLRLLVNPADDESLRRIINVPARGIGAVTLQHFESYASARHMPLLEVLREVETDETLPARARAAAAALVHLVDDLALAARNAPVAKLVEDLLERIEYRNYVQQSDAKDFRARIEVVDEFVSACAQHDARSGPGLLPFLQDMALVTDADALDPEAPAVRLLTCHNAKGLEFEHVYLAGLEEGLLPLHREDEDEEAIEEERRLCYVAMTRARQTLTLTAARSRMIYGRTQDYRQVSRFVDEVGPERLEHLHARKKAAPAAQAAPARAPVESQAMKLGTQVRHASFGQGTVMYTSGAGEKLKARIRFQTGKVVTLMVSRAPLEILEGKKR